MSSLVTSSLAARVVAGELRAVARAMRDVDDRIPGYLDLLKEIFPSTGRAVVVGVTGNPGVFSQQADSVVIENLRQNNYATTAAVFNLPNLRMAFTSDGC